MNNGLTTLEQTFDPYAGHCYALRATLLDFVQDDQQKTLEELSSIYNHNEGFRTTISNIDIDFSPSMLTYIPIKNETQSYINIRLPSNLLINPSPPNLFDYESFESLQHLESIYTDINWRPLPSENQIFTPVTEEFLPISRDSLLVWVDSLETELIKKQYINDVSMNNCGNLYKNIYHSPISGSVWGGPSLNTPSNANIEFVKKEEALGKSITYLFLEAIYNFINNNQQNPLVLSIFASLKEFESNYFESDSSYANYRLVDFFNDDRIVREPLDLIVYLRFPYEKCKTITNYEVEVRNNQILNMNPLKPETSNITSKPTYRRF